MKPAVSFRVPEVVLAVGGCLTAALMAGSSEPTPLGVALLVLLVLLLGSLVGLVLHLRRAVAVKQDELEAHAHDRAARLAESVARTQAILDSAVDAIITITERGIIESWNPAAGRLFGYAASEAIGQNVRILMAAPDREDHDTYLARYLTTGEKRIIGIGRQVTGLRKDGMVLPLHLSISEAIVDGRRLFTGIVRDLTQQHQVEAELHQSNLFQRAILDSANYSVISVNPDGIIRTFNAAAQRWLKYTAEEMVGRATPAVFHDPAEITRRAEEISRELGRPIPPGFEVFVARARLGHPDENEWTYVRKDGSRFPVLLSVTAIRDASGNLTGFMGIARDITERKRAESRIRTQHAVTRILAEAATLNEATPRIVQAIGECLEWDVGAIWTVAPGAAVLQCVAVWHAPTLRIPGFEAITRGRTFERGIGLPGRVWASSKPAWITDVAQDPNFPRLATAIREGLHGALAFPIHLASEFLGVIEFFSREIRTPDAELLQMFAAIGSQIGQFIERRRVEAELDRFFTLSLDMLCIAGFDGFFKRLNPAWETTLGWSQDELRSRPYLDFVHPDDRAATLTEAQKLVEGAETFSFENRYRCKDGSYKPLLWTAAPFREQHLIYAAARDITVLKRAEEEMRRAVDAAQSANRAKSDFLAKMSHELRTPLNSVIGFANILLKNKAGNLREQDLTYLQRIQENGKHLLALINNILDLSKVEAGKMELELAPVALDALVREVMSQFEAQLWEKSIDLVVDLPEQLVSIQADLGKLKQVVLNLVHNACKFTEKGSVTVRVTADPVSLRPTRLDVIDTGIGIPRDRLESIFEAFQQADNTTTRKYGGTGLGLTISRALCRWMGFRLEVRSEPGQGSTFSIVLGDAVRPEGGTPTEGPAPDTHTRLAAEAGPKKDERRRVLVIDDQADARLLLGHVIEECGCEVLMAESGEQGLAMARTNRPDLIMVDLLMPHVNGWEVVKALKDDPELQQIPVVVVSVVAREYRGAILGALDFLDKPVVREDVLRLLRRNGRSARGKVLIVEDDEDVRQILSVQLAEEASEIRTANHGQEALRLLESFTPDLIILDLMMPVMDGLTFLETIRNSDSHASLPVVVVTAKELSLTERNSLERQVSAILQKGDLFEEKLKLLLRQLIQAADQ